MRVFERKESPKQTQNSNSIFWSILQWFWILIPIIYFFMYLPGFTQASENPVVPLEQVFSMISLSFNLALGGLMLMMEPSERSRKSTADIFLKMAFVQQILTGQIAGVILVGLTWFNLPAKVNQNAGKTSDSDKIYLNAKTIYIITGLVLAFTLVTAVLRFIN